MTALAGPVAGRPPSLAAAGLEESLARFEPVSLEELVASADLQVRRDRKYLVPLDDITAVLARMASEEPPRALEIDGRRAFRYRSSYFDTPDLRSYHESAYGRPRRTKVRVRTYEDSGICMLEVKMRDNRGTTVKHRSPHVSGSPHLAPDGRDFVASLGVPDVQDLALTLTSTYRRGTLVFGQSGVRVTVDTSLAWCDAARTTLALPGIALFEVKSLVRSSPVDRALWRLGYRPSAISKYCTGLAALRPTLPANRWHRTLQRHLPGWRAPDGPGRQSTALAH